MHLPAAANAVDVPQHQEKSCRAAFTHSQQLTATSALLQLQNCGTGHQWPAVSPTVLLWLGLLKAGAKPNYCKASCRFMQPCDNACCRSEYLIVGVTPGRGMRVAHSCAWGGEGAPCGLHRNLGSKCKTWSWMVSMSLQGHVSMKAEESATWHGV